MLRNTFIFLKKIIISPRGLAVIAALPIVIAASQLSMIKEVLTDGAYPGFCLTVVQTGLEDRAMLLLFPVLCALPGAASYLEDRKCGVYRMALCRAGRRGYVWGRSIACGLSGGLTLAAGILLSCLLSLAVLGTQETGWTREELLPQVQQLAVITGQYLLSGIFWALFGMQLSIFTKSRYIAVLAPFAAYYILQMLQQRYFKKAVLLNPESWIVPSRYAMWDQNGLILLFIGALCLGLLAILAFSCGRDLKDA